MSDPLPADGLGSLGRRSWTFVGVVIAAAIIYLVFAQLSGLVVPLVVAAVLGILFVPLVDWGDQYIPRSVSAGLVLVGLLALGYLTVVVTVNGVIDQAPEIGMQLQAGLEALAEWLRDLGLSVGNQAATVGELEEVLGNIVPGLASFVGGAFSSLSAFVIGTFVAIFFLYFVLKDWDELSGWVGGHLRVPDDVGSGIVEDTVWSMRTYFYVLTGSALVSAVIIGLAMGLLGLPLVFTVALVTFVTSYIPYLGAIFSGAFAFLIALGAGGIRDAVIVVVVILVVQNVVQPIVQTKFTKDALDLHPIVTFGSTIVGTALAGILGATLSAPIVAMLISINKRLAKHKEPAGEPSS
jgi:predicted PurR-regulated permease PerM